MHAASLDLTNLAKDLEAASRNASKAVDQILSSSAQHILVEMKQLTPVKTGRLRGSETIQGSPGKYIVGPVGVPYAAYVEFGTSRNRPRPYVRPAVRKYLDDLGEKAAKVGVAMIMGSGYDEHS